MRWQQWVLIAMFALGELGPLLTKDKHDPSDLVFITVFNTIAVLLIVSL